MSQQVPVVVLGLILLLLEAKETTGGVHFLCLNYTVRAQVSPKQPWCEVQGSVDGKPFLQYDSDSSKAKPLGLLGEKVKNTKPWRDLIRNLDEMGRELRILLLVIKLEKNLTRDPRSLQAKLCCQRTAEKCTSASWEFSINGKIAVIDTKRMQWIVVDPGARGIKEQWESSQDLAEYFRNISIRSCCQWHKEFFEHWKKMLLSTVPPLTTTYTVLHSSALQLIASINMLIYCILLFFYLVNI